LFRVPPERVDFHPVDGFWWFCAIAFLLLGCGTGAIDRHYDAELESLHSRVRQASVEPACEEPESYGPSCGLMTRRLATEEFFQKFSARYCSGGRRTPDACDELYKKMLSALLRARYSAADFDRVASECDARPTHCDDVPAYERLLLESHNAGIADEGARLELEIEAERGRSHQADGESSAALVLATLDVLFARPPRREGY
jgi:hypothetical protein